MLLKTRISALFAVTFILIAVALAVQSQLALLAALSSRGAHHRREVREGQVLAGDGRHQRVGAAVTREVELREAHEHLRLRRLRRGDHRRGPPSSPR